MKRVFRGIIVNRIYYNFIFYSFKRILPIKCFYETLKNKPQEKRESQLRMYSQSIRDYNQNKYYNQLLKTFVPKWSLGKNQSVFIKKRGCGTCNLATFRKITVTNQFLFEKVYFSSCSELQTILWFQKYIFPLLIEEICIPRIQKIYKGDFISIIYFDFFDLKPFENIQEMVLAMVKLSKLLYTISMNHQKYIQQFSKASLFDFKEHFEYKIQRKTAKAELYKVGVSFERLEDQIAASTLIITHGDLYKTNFYKGNMLVDWDSFGIYPVAMEIAFFYQRIIRFKTCINEDFFNWLKNNYSEIVAEEKWKEFERNACFFLYVFHQPSFSESCFSSLKNQLTRTLKTY